MQGLRPSVSYGIALIFRPLFASTSLRGCHAGIRAAWKLRGGDGRKRRVGEPVDRYGLWRERRIGEVARRDRARGNVGEVASSTESPGGRSSLREIIGAIDSSSVIVTIIAQGRIPNDVYEKREGNSAHRR